jgi:hypothetical protein
MKTIWAAFVVGGSLAVAGATEIKTAAAFTQAVRSALEKKDLAELEALYYWNGTSEVRKAASMDHMKQMLEFESGKLASVSLVPLPAEFQETQVGFGKRIELTHKPAGLVQEKREQEPRQGFVGSAGTMRPYAIVDGSYYLLATKEVDLGWNGPEDKQLKIKIDGQGRNAIQITTNFNASGVPRKHTSTSGFSMIIGQHFDDVTLTCDDPKADLTMTLLEGDQEVYKSEPLKGAGKLVYQRKK